ncbi:RidA family protein [Nocardioides halotolerans]|uniref:RidA family protein n=1 Tax=Nocardioides halotolerans TaxID=433660 RepID=UPI0003FEB100|nr:RidA family protein [Nocardioides halotolerans]
MRSDLSDQLPPPPAPQGGYVPAVRHGDLVVSAGMTPRVDGRLTHRGRVGDEVTVEQAQRAAATAVANALSAVVDLAGAERLERVVHLAVYVNAAPGFEEHTTVADGASARLRELLGDAGAASRAAVGVTSLPGGACVEVVLTCGLAGA